MIAGICRPRLKSWVSLRNYARSVSQWIAQCPKPCCSCQSTPAGLDIDYESPMTFSPYRHHLLVCTGKDDWASKIELDTTVGPVTRHLKTLLGPAGKRGQKAIGDMVPGTYHNPFAPLSIMNASFPSSHVPGDMKQQEAVSAKDELPTKPTSIYLFPSFKYVTIPVPADAAGYALSLDSLIQEYVIRSSLDMIPMQEEKEVMLQQLKNYQASNLKLPAQNVNEVIVLICGHGGRDSRCGALGLPLQDEFKDKLERASTQVLPRQRDLDESNTSKAARVGLISHIGGHKWAGNVIIYIPPTWDMAKGSRLAGSAIWYGRVEPKHVEGIVNETVLGGRVIKELWRGGMQLSAESSGTSWITMRLDDDPEE